MRSCGNLQLVCPAYDLDEPCRARWPKHRRVVPQTGQGSPQEPASGSITLRPSGKQSRSFASTATARTLTGYSVGDTAFEACSKPRPGCRGQRTTGGYICRARASHSYLLRQGWDWEDEWRVRHCDARPSDRDLGTFDRIRSKEIEWNGDGIGSCRGTAGSLRLRPTNGGWTETVGNRRFVHQLAEGHGRLEAHAIARLYGFGAILRVALLENDSAQAGIEHACG